jgi:hypothetical protein
MTVANGPQFVELETPNVVASSAAFMSRNSAEPPGLSKMLGAARSLECRARKSSWLIIDP